MTENNLNSEETKSSPSRKEVIMARVSQVVELLEHKSSSLFIMSEDNIVRNATRMIVNSMIFEYVILAAILANCIVMALEEHLPENDKTELTETLELTEYYFLAIFSTETFLKIIAQGFILHPGSYMRNIWNVMDFFVVVTG